MNRLLAWCALVVAASIDAQASSDLMDRAERGDAEAQADLGDNYLTGDGAPKNRAEAMKWYRKSAAQGDAHAQYALGEILKWLDHGGDDEIPYDKEMDLHAEAVKWYQKAAAQGYALAEFKLGFMADGAQAFEWYRKAAEHGYPRAQLTLAMSYAEGRGTERNNAEAMAWYRKAAAKGDPLAEYQIGFMYQYGKTGPKDMNEALTWYRQAAQGGNPSAQATLRAAAMPKFAPCDLAQAQPKEWSEHALPELVFALPSQGKAQEVKSVGGSGPSSLNNGLRFVARDLTVTISAAFHSRSEAGTNTNIVRYGGGDAQINMHSADDGSGSISVSWKDVGRAAYTVNLVAEYANPGSQQMACGIVGSARLLDDVANMIVTRIEMDAKKPYAVTRNVYGNERRFHVGDDATRDFGRVAAITRQYVEIIELHPNGAGGWKESLIRLPLSGQ